MFFFFLLLLSCILIFSLFRGRRSRELSIAGSSGLTPSNRSTHELELLAEIARAGYKQATGEELSYSDESVPKLEVLLPTNFEIQENVSEPSIANERIATLGSFIGEVLIRRHQGKWMFDQSVHLLPFVQFPSGLRASPFDVLQSGSASSASLAMNYDELLKELQPQVIIQTTELLPVEPPTQEVENGTHNDLEPQ